MLEGMASPRWPWLAAPLALGSPSLVGCALPFGSPPVQVQAGASLRRLEGTQKKAPGLTFPGQLKVGVHPLQYLRGWTRRTVDFGGGYLADFDGTQSIHGAYAEVAPTLLRSTRGPIRRLSLRGQARALHAVGYPGWGYGGAVQLSGEWGGFVPGIIDYRAGTSGITGYGWGESTVGFYIEMGYGQIDTIRSFTMTGGLQWRIPATVGAAFVALGDEKKGRAADERRKADEERRERGEPTEEDLEP
jgi:hypothetical protein